MKKSLISGICLAVLSACASQGPGGAGSSDYDQYRAQRGAQLSASARSPQGAGTGAVMASRASGANPRGSGIEAAPGNVAPALRSHPGISDEQDFEAVSERESIESDAARRARQAAAYEVIAPEAVPTRTGAAGPNIVQYALQTTNAKGQKIYSRLNIAAQSRFQRNCARYTSPDEAQRDFLARGGPERDTLGLDPDGDGFACGWDPAPFRAVARN